MSRIQRVEPDLHYLDDVTAAMPWLNAKPAIVLGDKASADRWWAKIGSHLPATSSVGGLGQWNTGHVERLMQVGVKDVAVIPDGHRHGWQHAYAVARSCAAAGLGVRVAFLPDGIPTVEAYVNAGHDKRALEALVLAAPTFSDPSLAPTRDREVRPVPWLWPGRISLGGVTVLDSAYGSAMRLVAIDLAARVSTGRAMPDGASGLAAAADVVVATHRGLSHTVLAGLEAAGADVSRVTHMACEVEDLLSETDLEALSSSIPDGRQLVVIDPGVCPAVASFPTPKGGAAARAALEWMQRLAKGRGHAILMLRDLHVGSDPEPRSSGSSVLELLGVARNRLTVERDGDDKHPWVLASTPPELGGGVAARTFAIALDDGREATIVWGDPGTRRTAVPPERAEDHAVRKSAVELARQFLSTVLADGPLPAKAVTQRAAEAGIAMPTLRRAKSQDNVMSTKRGGPGGVQGWWWTLPRS